MTYRTKGVCSKTIEFEIVDNKVTNVKFQGGCQGNLSGIAVLVEGMDVKDAIQRLAGIQCGPRGTSCPDQLSKALIEATA